MPRQKMFLSSINPGIVPVQGTSIASALNLALNSFTQQEDMNRAVIIITDGEDHEEDPVNLARSAQENGIRIYTIGVGLPEGSPIPVSGSGQNEFKKDQDGNVVISKLNEVMLQEIATAGGGKYIRSNNTSLGLNALFDDINQLEKKEIEARIYSEHEDLFQYPAMAAFILLIVEFMVLSRKNRALRNISLFRVQNQRS